MPFVPVTGDDYDPADYDPDKFYCTDTGGDQLRARVSSELARAVVELCNDPVMVHYHTPADFVRDAVVHLMHRRIEQASDPGFRLHMEERMREHQAHLRMREIADQAKADQADAGHILNNVGLSTTGGERAEMLKRARVLERHGMIQHSQRDELRRLLGREVTSDNVADYDATEQR